MNTSLADTRLSAMDESRIARAFKSRRSLMPAVRPNPARLLRDKLNSKLEAVVALGSAAANLTSTDYLVTGKKNSSVPRRSMATMQAFRPKPYPNRGQEL